jgi:hypothetical protein
MFCTHCHVISSIQTLLKNNKYLDDLQKHKNESNKSNKKNLKCDLNNWPLIVVYLTTPCVNWAFFGMSEPV